MNAWYDSFKERLSRLSELSDGWDSYQAPRPSTLACSHAGEALKLLARGVGTPPQRLAASVEGGVAISWRRGPRDADIEFFNDGEIFAATSGDTGEPHIWQVVADEDDLASALETIREFLDAEPPAANAPSGATG